ncbi:hypothetical protein VNO78_07507 [Psophocarpus tetragonolobus]|uniref:Bulb-type lectin domain-containing protein n=1 Tax=Psophocarpus tetragonolobus TaxID=3891 RepID=A0AAN9XRZ5_PSOTE
MSFTMLLTCILALLSLSHLNGLHAIEIEPNSSITAGSNSTWKSPSGDFEFGFYALPSGLFLVGIWYGRIPETLVWYSSTSVEPNSQIQFTSAGQLVVAHPDGSIAQNIFSGAASSAQMRDDGNFVMKNSNLRPVWESFNSPANTILPGQTLQSNQILYSKGKGDSNYSLGNYMLQMQRDGNLLLKAYHWSDPAYWYTSTLTPNVSLVFNATTALMYLVSGNRITYSLSNTPPTSVKDYYHRATIDENGNFQQYAYHKRNGTEWRRVWRAVEDPCRVNAICGVYGFCTSPSNESVKCECIPGYIPMDHQDVSKGCHPPAVINYCAEINFKLQVFEDTDFQFNTDFFRLANVTFQGCKKAVTDDCNIVAATYNTLTSTCVKKSLPLLNARNSSSSKGQIALLKVPNTVESGTFEVPKNKSFNVRVFLKVLLAVTATLACFFGAFAVYYHPFTQRLTRRTKRHIESCEDGKNSEDDDLVLSNWILRCVVSRKLEVVVRHDSEVLNDFKRFEEMALVGLWCVHPNPAFRPSIKQVMQMLDGTVEVGVPPLVHDLMMVGQGL